MPASCVRPARKKTGNSLLSEAILIDASITRHWAHWDGSRIGVAGSVRQERHAYRGNAALRVGVDSAANTSSGCTIPMMRSALSRIAIETPPAQAA
jgi:hypothetical protein